MIIVEDCKNLMRGRCIICGDLRNFFSPPFVEPLALSFGFVPLTTVCDFFLLMVFILLCCLSSISFYFQFSFSLGLILVLFLVICFFKLESFLTCIDSRSSFFLHMIFSESYILEGKRVKVQIGHLRSVLDNLSSWNICWKICLNALNKDMSIMNNILSSMAEL